MVARRLELFILDSNDSILPQAKAADKDYNLRQQFILVYAVR